MAESIAILDRARLQLSALTPPTVAEIARRIGSARDAHAVQREVDSFSASGSALESTLHHFAEAFLRNVDDARRVVLEALREVR